jgi:hypothetical protein
MNAVYKLYFPSTLAKRSQLIITFKATTKFEQSDVKNEPSNIDKHAGTCFNAMLFMGIYKNNSVHFVIML